MGEPVRWKTHWQPEPLEAKVLSGSHVDGPLGRLAYGGLGRPGCSKTIVVPSYCFFILPFYIF